jgi:hypothetical protein
MHLTFSPSRPSISFATLQPSLTPPNTNTNSPVKQASLQRQGFTSPLYSALIGKLDIYSLVESQWQLPLLKRLQHEVNTYLGDI